MMNLFLAKEMDSNFSLQTPFSEYDTKSNDFYLLGMVFYKILFKENPHEKIIEVHDFHSMKEKYHPEIIEILIRLLDHDPNRRFNF